MLPAAYTWTLTLVAIAAGIALLWAFGRFSDQKRIAAAKGKLRASLYAFRLFADEPALIWRAQKQLLAWNARYVALMLRPAVVTIVPVVALLFLLDSVYGHRPLHPGETAIASAKIASAAPLLEGTGFAVETPPVRVPAEGRVFWRIRASSENVVVRGAQVAYPSAEIGVFGAGMHWLVWFTMVSLITMLALRKRFRVTF